MRGSVVASAGKPELVLLKLGGSLMTDKSRRGSFRADVVRRLGREIRRTLERRPNLRLLIGHGAGAIGGRGDGEGVDAARVGSGHGLVPDDGGGECR